MKRSNVTQERANKPAAAAKLLFTCTLKGEAANPVRRIATSEFTIEAADNHSLTDRKKVANALSSAESGDTSVDLHKSINTGGTKKNSASSKRRLQYLMQ